VLDTSVLLSDPWACSRFAEHAVVVPLVVISELEDKRHHHELGWFARQALRMFDDLRLEHGRLDQPIPIGTHGGTLQIELNHSDPSVLPAGFRTGTNDARILTCAANLAAEGKLVTLVSKDIPLRVKAGAVGLPADEYHAQDVVASGWTGTRRRRWAASTRSIGSVSRRTPSSAIKTVEWPIHRMLARAVPGASSTGRS
jgi:PhoH-like ATPase